MLVLSYVVCELLLNARARFFANGLSVVDLVDRLEAIERLVPARERIGWAGSRYAPLSVPVVRVTRGDEGRFADKLDSARIRFFTIGLAGMLPAEIGNPPIKRIVHQ